MSETLSPAADTLLSWLLEVGLRGGVFDASAQISGVDADNWVKVMHQLSIELGCSVDYTSHLSIQDGDPAKVTITH